MSATNPTQNQAYEDKRDAFVDRMLSAARGTFDTFTIYLGYRLGYYEKLAEQDALTSRQLAEKTGTHERYVREWLEQQTVAGILYVENESADPEMRRYRLPDSHAEVLAERDSLNYLAPLSQILAGAVRPLPELLEAYKTGQGVTYQRYGADLREGQAGMNRAMFLKALGTEWLPSIPDIHERLRSDPPARVADFGCGFGYSSIGMADAYPKIQVDGYDLDGPSVEKARLLVREAGLENRVRIHLKDVSDENLKGAYDMVTAFECVHDMADPVGALRTMLGMVGEKGSVIVMDERVGERFTAQGNEVEWFMYGFSVLHCLPVGKSEGPSAETGTVMRTDTLKRYAEEAGFCDVEILPIDNFFFRFYRLNPVCRIER